MHWRRVDGLPESAPTSELQTNPGANHGLFSEVYVWIVVELPKPFRTVIVDAQANVIYEVAGFGMPRFEKAIERDAVVAIELVTPNDMSILLLCVQANIEDCECRDAIVAA